VGASREETTVSDESSIDHPAGGALTPVVVRKATDLIAEQIRHRIFSGEYQAGDILPSEADLIAQTASSGSSVRGALRILETQGLIHMKQGRSGGAIVKVPGQSELESTMNQLIRGQDISLTQLLGMQEAIEPLCARLAAESRTDADLAHIQAALESITGHTGDVPSLLEAHSVWHVAVARGSHNELLSGLMIALVRWIHVATRGESVVAGRVSSTPYEQITKAVQDRDGDEAFALMKKHVTARARVMTRLAAQKESTEAP
jgi:GntR family transcriptional repressor for pyruvate dehydrogenase complex